MECTNGCSKLRVVAEGCLIGRHAAAERTNGCSKGKWDAEPQEAAQQVPAHRGGGACSNGALPVCLSSARAGSQHYIASLQPPKQCRAVMETTPGQFGTNEPSSGQAEGFAESQGYWDALRGWSREQAAKCRLRWQTVRETQLAVRHTWSTNTVPKALMTCRQETCLYYAAHAVFTCRLSIRPGWLTRAV